MAALDDREFDIIVFGATGFTGRYVMEELCHIYFRDNVRWAIAGRYRNKLEKCIHEVQMLNQKYTFMDSVGIIIADVEDEASLSRMCARAKVILNCVGPYIFHGETVLQKCVETGTHHVDISGEFKYQELTQARYFRAARQKEIYIVQACGFDSIPADLGTAMLKREFNGELEKVEIFMKFIDGPQGKVTNIGTWMSAIHSIGCLFEAEKIRNFLKLKVFTRNMPRYKVGLGFSMPLSYNANIKCWCVPLSAPDVPVIQRSQMFEWQFFRDIPVEEVKVYLCISSFFRALGVLFLASIVGLMSLFSCGRYLLGKFPQFFSAGYFSNRGPSRDQVMNSAVTITLIGKGSSDDTLAYDIRNKKDDLPPIKKKKLGLKITGPDPAYRLTSICMVHAGLVILHETDRMPLKGGVLTPGSAFINTSLADRLRSRGIKFEWIRESDPL